MGRAVATREMKGPRGAAERLWYDTARWPAFIDGFARLVEVEGDWPHAGARVVWDSTPAGRGRVIERVVEHEPGAGQCVEVEDPRLRGMQRIAFEPRDDGLAVTLELEYGLKQGGPLAPLVDALFIRRAMRDSLNRTLAHFSHELAGELEALR